MKKCIVGSGLCTCKHCWYFFQLLNALKKFGNNLDEYLHLVLPPIVKLFDATEYPTSCAKEAMETIDHLSDSLDFQEYASRIIHALVICSYVINVDNLLLTII